MFFFRRPLEFVFGPPADVAQMTNSGPAVSGLDVCYRSLTRSNTVKPILYMVVADIEFEFALSKTIEATKEQEAVPTKRVAHHRRSILLEAFLQRVACRK